MAWQLIYTSAPRSLEAGRSGFGTVARHRAISPLLVSAIERASQFSRLPGTDAGRVIFCHRIIAIAGGRFHVLSAIRDAGADYTGRTNHIAHHLIVDPREIAQLGADGPSPADVLLAMQWVTSWNETPRYLEASDEVALSAIHPHTNSSAWEQVAGSASQAWLLATGDASRGAYIIQPGGTNLRAVFAESLRLIPERLWQISFTTSLQPSDEPADFRWIGIEERSPLRSQSESSGRPVLNLAAPDTLPLVEMVQPSAVNQHREFSTPVSTPAQAETRTASFGMPSSASDANSFPTHERNTEAQSVSPAGRLRIQPKWWLLAGAAAAVALIGTLVFSFLVKPYLQKQAARNAMAESFGATGYFPNDICQKLAEALIESADDFRCKQLASASKALIQTLQAGVLAKLNSEQTSESLKVLENRDGLQLPEELGKVREAVKDAQRYSVEPSDFKKVPGANELYSIMEKRRFEISEWPPGKKLPNLVAELKGNVERQAANRLLSMLPQHMTPPEGIETFKKSAEDFEKRILDREAKITIEKLWPRLKEVKVKQQASLPNSGPAKPAPPVQEEKPPGVTKAPAITTQVPLYFFNGENTPLRIKLPTLGKPLTFSITEGGASAYELSDPNKTGNLRKGFADPLFKLGHFEQTVFEMSQPFNAIELEKNNVKLPFRLSAQDESKTEVFQFWFVQQSSVEPLLHNKNGGLQNDGTNIVVDSTIVQLPGLPHEALYLETPDTFVPGRKGTFYPLTNLRLDLSPIVAPIKAQQKDYLDQKGRIKLPTRDSLFEQNEFFAKSQLTDKGAKAYVSRDAQNPVQRCGAMLAEYGFDLVKFGLNDVPKIPGNEMTKCGKELFDANREFESLRTRPQDKRGAEYPKHLREKEERAENAKKAALALSNEIQKALLDPSTGSNIKQNAIKLTPLWNMFDLAFGDEKRANELLDKPKADAESERAKFDKLSKELGLHPLLNNAVPAGRYRLLVDFSKLELSNAGADKKYPLLEFLIEAKEPLPK